MTGKQWSLEARLAFGVRSLAYIMQKAETIFGDMT